MKGNMNKVKKTLAVTCALALMFGGGMAYGIYGTVNADAADSGAVKEIVTEAAVQADCPYDGECPYNGDCPRYENCPNNADCPYDGNGPQDGTGMQYGKADINGHHGEGNGNGYGAANGNGHHGNGAGNGRHMNCR